MAQTVRAAMLLLVAVASVCAQESDSHYCSLCADHTMCKYTGPGPKCSPRIGGGVSDADIATILGAHNTYRQNIAEGLETRGAPGPQPNAANMRKMVWSSELATIAQRWADQCNLKTDSCRRVTEFQVGQNLYKASSFGYDITPQWQESVTSWYENVKKFNKNSISPYRWGNAGGYTQLAWAESYQVGCGYTEFKEVGDEEWIHQIYVCNYGPRGNTVSATMYKKGEACSKCPAGTSCSDPQFSALCV